jgi:SAM-dependent methyltransferase
MAFLRQLSGKTIMSTPVALPREDYKPSPVRIAAGGIGRIRFALRRLVDLQLASIWQHLGPRLAHMSGDVLDVGCGEMPFRSFLPTNARYVGIDVAEARSFGMTLQADIRPFDGQNIPFVDASFDHVLCTEVLEHAEHPEMLLTEMLRVLRPGGTLVATVPFSARVHHAPHDYQRFSCHKLSQMFAPYADTHITPRGTDLAVIANKLIVLCIRLARPSVASLWRLPLLLLVAPVASAMLVVAHGALVFGWGSTDDPLGYAIIARRGDTPELLTLPIQP